MQLKIIWRESLPAVIFPGTWSKPERVMIGMWGVVQSFFFAYWGLSWPFVNLCDSRKWARLTWGTVSLHFLEWPWKNCTGSFFFCWDRLGNGLILASCCVPNQGGTFDCVSLFSWDGPARTEKGRCFVVTLVSEWGDGMYHVTCWVTLACGLLCTFVVSLETEACPAGISVGSLRDSSKLWGIVLALGLRPRAGGEQDGPVRLMLIERCSCAGSTLKWKQNNSMHCPLPQTFV